VTGKTETNRETKIFIHYSEHIFLSRFSYIH